MADQLDADPCQPDDGLSARERILAAAERLFAERGFDRTSTALIAADAGVPHGLIFYHFKTKMELLLAVIRADQAGLWTRRSRRWPRPPPGDGLRRAVAACGGTCPRCSASRPRSARSSCRKLAAHPRSASAPWNYTSRWPRWWPDYLAQASLHPGEPGPEHEAAARLLTIAAGMAPLLGEPSARR